MNSLVVNINNSIVKCRYELIVAFFIALNFKYYLKYSYDSNNRYKEKREVYLCTKL